MTGPRLLKAEEKAEILLTLKDLRNAQGFALNAAAIFIEVTTSESDDARADVAQQFRTFRDLYSKAITDVKGHAALRALDAKADGLMATALDVATRFRQLDETQDFGAVSAVEAGRLVNFVRLQGVPALMQLTAQVSGAKKDHDKAVQGVMKERIAKLDKMFNEVEDIGRMIHLISLNASVEAARAGGESGRSFKVIADEIRGLAQQASVLIDATREGVLPGTEADLLNMASR